MRYLLIILAIFHTVTANKCSQFTLTANLTTTTLEAIANQTTYFYKFIDLINTFPATLECVNASQPGQNRYLKTSLVRITTDHLLEIETTLIETTKNISGFLHNKTTPKQIEGKTYTLNITYLHIGITVLNTFLLVITTITYCLKQLNCKANNNRLQLIPTAPPVRENISRQTIRLL